MPISAAIISSVPPAAMSSQPQPRVSLHYSSISWFLLIIFICVIEKTTHASRVENSRYARLSTDWKLWEPKIESMNWGRTVEVIVIWGLWQMGFRRRVILAMSPFPMSPFQPTILSSSSRCIYHRSSFLCFQVLINWAAVLIFVWDFFWRKITRLGFEFGSCFLNCVQIEVLLGNFVI